MRKKRILTQEQIDYRNSLLRGKASSIKKSEKPPEFELTTEDKLRKHFYYLNNCVYWINEYIEGRVDKKRLLETAKAIQKNGLNLEIELLNIKPKDK